MIVHDTTDRAARERVMSAASAAIRRGDLVLVPTESSYALATDAFSARGRAAMRAAKQSADNVPLPVVVPSATTVHGLASSVPADATALMTACWPGLLTVLVPAQPTLAWDHPAGAPVAVRMPLHPVLLELLRAVGPMALTSANAPGMVPPTSVADAVAQLGEVAVLALDAGELAEAEPSTIVDVTSGRAVVRRLGAVSVDELRAVVPDLTIEVPGESATAP